MMEGVVGLIRKVAEREIRSVLTTEVGVVTAVFPHADEGDTDNYQCSVQLLNKNLESGEGIELKRVPVATPYLGLACIPSVGDLVLLSFIGGDIHAPVITHRLYNDEDRPPVNLADEFLLQHKIAEGGSLKLDAEGRIVLTSRSEENTLTLDDESITLSNEKFTLKIDFSGEKITLASDKDIELLAPNGKCLIDAKEVEIRSGGDLKLEARSGKLQAEASEAEVKASGNGKLEAGGALAVKGATIDLN
jgi:uncharacterized protein involved in type VI secretion and phage assembly